MSAQTNSPDQWSAINNAEAKLIWDEYKYRHEHVWKTIINLTAAVTALSIVPYLHDKAVCALDYIIIMSPILGVGLSGFGFLRLIKEIKRMDLVRDKYRKRQSDKFQFPKLKSSFQIHVIVYLVFLLLLAVGNIAVVLLAWIPYIKPTCC
jgi:hypothetical protein